MTPAAGGWTTPMTDRSADQLLHHVPDAQAALASRGVPVRAVCGRSILPAALSAPAGRPCPRCAAGPGLVGAVPALPSAPVVSARHDGCLPGSRRLRGLLPW
jgi:hypothetical protein